MGGCGPNRVGRAVAAGRRWGRTALVRQRVAAFTARSQLVHADLPGNVVSIRIYRRWSSTCPPTGGPPRFAAGAIVAGALVWEGAGGQLLESLQWVADDAQLLLRALLFRAVTDLLHRPHEEPTIVTRPCQPALNSRFASRGLTSPFLTTPPAQPARPAGKQASPGRAASPSRLRILLGVSRR